MKNLVISRKGFDATAGGRASPIFENGDIFSVPIPQKRHSPSRYRDLRFNHLSGKEILNLIGAKFIGDKDFCHNDPMLSEKKGASIINGNEMLENQAMESWKIWNS